MEFDFGQLLMVALPLVAGILGFALGKVKSFIAATPTKLDDAIWNNLVKEFTAAGVITQDQLDKLVNQG